MYLYLLCFSMYNSFDFQTLKPYKEGVSVFEEIRDGMRFKSHIEVDDKGVKESYVKVTKDNRVFTTKLECEVVGE